MKLPIEFAVELKAAMAPIVREQTRATLIAHALQGLVMREPGNISVEDEEDLAAQAVRLAGYVTRALFESAVARDLPGAVVSWPDGN